MAQLQPNTAGTLRGQRRRTPVHRVLASTGVVDIDRDGLTGAQRLSSYAGLSTYSWADQSESATTMTTRAVIVNRGGRLLTWDGRQ
jgi:hypothetical protein